MRIARKLIIPTLILIGLIIMGLIAYNTIVSIRQFEELEQSHLDEMHKVFLARIQAREELALALAFQVANTSEVQAAFAARDRDKLLELTLPQYELLRDRFGIVQEHFHLPPATSFLRVHSLGNYGDDLSNVRPTIVQANTNQEVVRGLDIGRAGVGIRGVVPIFYEGEHIGVVEFGTDVEQDLVKELKNDFGYEWQILITKDAAAVITLSDFEKRVGMENDRFIVYASTLPKPVFSTGDSYDKVLNGEHSYVYIGAEKKHYMILSAPLHDFSGVVIGSVDIMSDHTQVVKARNQQLWVYAFALAGMFLLVGFGFSIITRRTLRPIETLTSVASAVGTGDFSQHVEMVSDDEIGTLAQSFNVMTEQLRTLVGTLEQRTRALEQRSAYLEASAEVGRAAASILDVEQLIRQVVELIRERFGLYYVGLFLVEAGAGTGDVDAGGEWAVLRAGTGEAGQTMLARGHRLRVGAGMIGWSIANAEARIALDVGEDAVRFDNPDLPDTHSEGALPLRSRGRVLGALTVQSDQSAAFDEATVAVLQMMADQVAMALDNAQLLAESQAALESARRAYGEVSREAWRKLLRSQSRLDARYDPQVILPPEGYWREDMKRAVQEERVIVDAGDRPDAAVATQAAVPIKVRGQVVGVLDARKLEDRGRWMPEEIALLETLAEQLSVALDSARLYQDTQRRAARERTLGEVTGRIRETLDMDTMLHTAANEIRQALNLAEVEICLGVAPESGE